MITLRLVTSLILAAAMTMVMSSKTVASFAVRPRITFSGVRTFSLNQKNVLDQSVNNNDVSNSSFKDDVAQKDTGTNSYTSKYVAVVSDVANSYSTFLLDMWGVMHDGSTPYHGVLDTVKELKAAGKKLIILSNSSKRQSNAIQMLKKLGFETGDFDQIITSGEISYRMLAGDQSLGCTTWKLLSDLIEADKKKVFVFGSGDRDEEYCDSSGWNLAPVEEADLILARGTFTINDGKTVVSKKDGEKKYFDLLQQSLAVAASKNIPMLVSNPDKVRPDKGLPPMPGAIGDSYEAALGGEDFGKSLVKRIGKPFPEVYEIALEGISTSPSDTIMVGDALETDIIGGSNSQCSTLWVTNDGIHGPTIKDKLVNDDTDSYEKGTKSVLKSFNEEKGLADEVPLAPTYIVPHMRW